MDYELTGHFGYRRIVRATVPTIVTMVVMSRYSVVDGLFISNCVGTTAFAAVNLMWPALMLASSLGLMTGAGGNALVAKTMGEGYPENANRIFSMVAASGLWSGVVIGLLLFVLARHVALLMGADGEMLRDCVLYTRICAVGMPFFINQMAFQSLYPTAGKPQLGTLMSVLSGLVNIALDALLVAWLKTGVVGAAVATMLSQVVGGLVPVLYFMRRRRGALLRLVRTHWIGRYMRQVCLNGLSEYVASIAVNVVSICYNLQLMRYIGHDGVAAYGVLMYIGFLFSAVFIGYNIGVAPAIGYNYGAQNRAELHNLFRKSLAILAMAGVVMTALAELSANFLANIFVGYDEALCALTIRATRLYCASFLICGFNMFVSSLFTALNNGVVSAVASFARTLVFELGAVLLLPLVIGIDGIWLAVDVAELLTLVLTISILLAFRKRYGY